MPANDTIDVSTVSYLDMGNFSGTVYQYSEAGELTAVEGYDQGKLEKILTLSKDKKSSNRSAKLQPDCPLNEICSEGGTYAWVDIDGFTDYYVSVNGSTPRYQYSEQTGHRRDLVYVPSSEPAPPKSQHEHRPHGGSGSSGGSSSSHPKEIIQSTSFIGTKIACVFGKMSRTNTLKTYLQKFDGSFSVANLILKTDDLEAVERALTSPPLGTGTSPNYAITIRFNNDNSSSGYNQRPTLLNAKTIIHEMIHAELYRKLMSVAQSGNLNTDQWTRQQQIAYVEGIRENFPGIYDYYTRYVKNWQHAQMATHYRETIAGALQEFDNKQHSWQFYMDLAWEGLRYNTPSWNSLSSTEKSRIDSVINNYRKTGSRSCP